MRAFATDSEVMQHAISLARKGFGFVAPNPMVGAVILSHSGEWIEEIRNNLRLELEP